MKKFFYQVTLASVIMFLFCFGNCPKPRVKKTPVFKSIEVFPTIRCPHDPLTVVWTIEPNDYRPYGIAVCIDDVPALGHSCVSYSSNESDDWSGSILIDNPEEEFQGQLPSEFTLNVNIANNEVNLYGQDHVIVEGMFAPTHFRINTVIGEDVSTEHAGRQSAGIYTKELASPNPYSSNINVVGVKLHYPPNMPEDCSHLTFQIKKGLSGPTELLNADNNYSVRFANPELAQGIWTIQAIDDPSNCLDKEHINSLKLDFSIVCSN